MLGSNRLDSLGVSAKLDSTSCVDDMGLSGLSLGLDITDFTKDLNVRTRRGPKKRARYS